MCSGINCGFYGISQGNIIFLCPENDCLICVNFNIMIFSECDNSEVCSGLDGCLNCLTNDECLICNQGYYLIGRIKKKCSEGCSICSRIPFPILIGLFIQINLILSLSMDSLIY